MKIFIDEELEDKKENSIDDRVVERETAIKTAPPIVNDQQTRAAASPEVKVAEEKKVVLSNEATPVKTGTFRAVSASNVHRAVLAPSRISDKVETEEKIGEPRLAQVHQEISHNDRPLVVPGVPGLPIFEKKEEELTVNHSGSNLPAVDDKEMELTVKPKEDLDVVKMPPAEEVKVPIEGMKVGATVAAKTDIGAFRDELLNDIQAGKTAIDEEIEKETGEDGEKKVEAEEIVEKPATEPDSQKVKVELSDSPAVFKVEPDLPKEKIIPATEEKLENLQHKVEVKPDLEIKKEEAEISHKIDGPKEEMSIITPKVEEKPMVAVKPEGTTSEKNAEPMKAEPFVVKEVPKPEAQQVLHKALSANLSQKTPISPVMQTQAKTTLPPPAPVETSPEARSAIQIENTYTPEQLQQMKNKKMMNLAITFFILVVVVVFGYLFGYKYIIDFMAGI